MARLTDLLVTRTRVTKFTWAHGDVFLNVHTQEGNYGFKVRPDGSATQIITGAKTVSGHSYRKITAKRDLAFIQQLVDGAEEINPNRGA